MCLECLYPFLTLSFSILQLEQVNPSDLSNDADPKFLAEFYKNLKILSQDLYKKSVVASTNPTAAFSSPDRKAAAQKAKFKAQPSFSAKDRDVLFSAQQAIAEDGSAGATPGASGAANAAVLGHSADHFSAESLHDRMRLYAQQGAIPMDFLDRYTAGRGRGNTTASEHDE